MEYITKEVPPDLRTHRKAKGRHGGKPARKGGSMGQEGLLFPKEGRKKPRKRHPRSILPGDRKGWCWLCDKQKPTEEHHIYGGPCRKASEEYGLKVHLCLECHRTGPRAAHACKDTADILHRAGQRAFEEKAGSRSEFIRVFGRNYL